MGKPFRGDGTHYLSTIKHLTSPHIPSDLPFLIWPSTSEANHPIWPPFLPSVSVVRCRPCTCPHVAFSGWPQAQCGLRLSHWQWWCGHIPNVAINSALLPVIHIHLHVSHLSASDAVASGWPPALWTQGPSLSHWMRMVDGYQCSRRIRSIAWWLVGGVLAISFTMTR